MSENKQVELKEEDLTKVTGGDENTDSIFITFDKRTQSHPENIDDLYCKYCKQNRPQWYTGMYFGYASNGNSKYCYVYECKYEECKQRNYYTVNEGGLI